MAKIEQIANFFRKKRVLILGFGREGKSSYNFLVKNNFELACLAIADGNENLKIADKSKIDELYLGNNYLSRLEDYDLVLKSPGIKLAKEILEKQNIYSQTEIFLKFFKDQTIGVTGTKGKSTTSSLIYHLFKELGYNPHLGGNIGIPAFDLINQIKDQQPVILELSCHQLQKISASPHIALLLNIYPEHLDYYDSFEEYREAKLNIFKFQAKNDILITAQENLTKKSFFVSLKKDEGQIGAYVNDQKLDFNLDLNKMNILGEHNLLNSYLAYFAVKKYLEKNKLDIKPANFYNFKGLRHRLQKVGEFSNILFINDSISTIPETSISAIKSLNNQVDYLILGGYERKNINFESFTPLISKIREAKPKIIILIPDTGFKIEKMVKRDANFYSLVNSLEDGKIGYYLAQDLAAGLRIIKKFHNPKFKATCLLSPASASYNQFKNFEERGEVFERIILKLFSK